MELLTSTLSFTPLLFHTISGYLESICIKSSENYVMHEDFKNEPDHITLQAFVQRIYKNSRCSSSCLIVACMFLNVIKTKNPDLIFAESNIRRLYLIATMLATKTYEDHVFLNTQWVVISDNVFSITTINRMERELLCLLNFALLFSPSEYASFCSLLARKFQPQIKIPSPDTSIAPRLFEEKKKTSPPPTKQALAIKSSSCFSSSSFSSTCPSSSFSYSSSSPFSSSSRALTVSSSYHLTNSTSSNIKSLSACSNASCSSAILPSSSSSSSYSSSSMSGDDVPIKK